jgi:hypothetical protein
MSEIGDTVQVEDEFAPETGEYTHSRCDTVISLCKNNRMPPCYNASCPKKDAEWILTKIDCEQADLGD